MASKLPKAANDLASKAQNNVGHAHDALCRLRKMLEKKRFARYNFSISATGVFHNSVDNKFTLVEWSGLMVGASNRWELHHEELRAPHQSMQADLPMQRDFQFLVALADIYESAFFKGRADFFEKNLPSRWLKDTGEHNPGLAGAKWLMRPSGRLGTVC